MTDKNKSTIDTPENWDAASEGYAEKIAPVMMATFADEFVDLLDVNKDTDVLEVASGSGAITEPLARRVKSVLAVDFSPKMILQATKKIKNAGLENVTFRNMDAQALEIEDAVYERAISSFALMLFPDRHKGFSELKRVLKKGGKAVVSGWAAPDKFETFGLFIEALYKAFPDYPKPESPPPALTLSDPADFKSQMEAAGFKDVEVKFTKREMTIENFDSLWSMMTIGAPPVKMLFEKVGPEGIEKVHVALRKIVEKRFGSGPVTLINTATVGVGIVSS